MTTAIRRGSSRNGASPHRVAAQMRVSTRDLMARMGRDDMRTALSYQRATQEAAEHIVPAG